MPRVVRAAWIFMLAALAFQAAVGLSAAVAIDTPLWASHQQAVARELGLPASLGPAVRAYRDWVMGPLGGTIVGWAVALLFVVAGPMRRREPWAWWAVAVSTLAWFGIDTTLSWVHGATTNVGFNLMALTMLAIPWALTVGWGTSGAGPQMTRR